MKYNILYVTSFNKRLFNLTGKNMLSSFITKQIEGDMLIVYEDGIIHELPTSNTQQFYYHNLNNVPELTKWFQDNKDIIPKQYGGNIEDCKCKIIRKKKFVKVKKPTKKFKALKITTIKKIIHVKDCPFKAFDANETNFNQKVLLWFKKIVALHLALQFTNIYTTIIFVDSDILFKKQITQQLINDTFDQYDVFGHLGEYRKKQQYGVESGFIGFRNQNGTRFLRQLINIYFTNQFKQYRRWDDSFILQKLLEEVKTIKFKDMVNTQTQSMNVVENGILRNYIRHFKGIHYNPQKYKK